jgi:exopolysaccharide production protein ExoQ
MKRLEWYFHIIAFAVQCGAIISLFLRTGDDPADLGAANPLNTISNAVILAVTLALMLGNARAAIRYMPRIWPILALVLLTVISMSWSDYPDTTLRRSGSLVTATLWALYVTTRYDLSDVLAIIRQATGLTALASLVIGVAAPDIGRDVSLGPAGWRGVFSNKNDLGMAMAIGTATYFYTLMSGRQKGIASFIPQLAGLLFCMAALYLANSSTSLVIALLGIALCVPIKLTHKRVGAAIIIWTAILLLLAPTVIIVTDQLEAIAPLLGRDAQLTGRVDLWLILPSYIAERPWLGYGFGAFWVADSANVALIWEAVGWAPPHAHNGWLDLLLELGVVGLTLMCLQILLIVVNAIRAIVEGHEPDSQYLLMATLIILVFNISESDLVRPGVMWILLVVAATALAKIGAQRQPAKSPYFRYRYQDPLGTPLER